MPHFVQMKNHHHQNLCDPFVQNINSQEKEELEDTKGIIRATNRRRPDNKKSTKKKNQIKFNKTLPRKPKIEQLKPHKTPGVISGAPETSQNTRSDLRCPRNLTNHQE